MLQQYFISIDARLRSRNSTVSVKAGQPSAWLHESQLLRDAYTKESRLFMCTFFIIQIWFSDRGRFLWVNAYFGASIHPILFLFSIKVNKKHGKKNENSVEFT